MRSETVAKPFVVIEPSGSRTDSWIGTSISLGGGGCSGRGPKRWLTSRSESWAPASGWLFGEPKVETGLEGRHVPMLERQLRRVLAHDDALVVAEEAGQAAQQGGHGVAQEGSSGLSGSVVPPGAGNADTTATPPPDSAIWPRPPPPIGLGL